MLFGVSMRYIEGHIEFLFSTTFARSSTRELQSEKLRTRERALGQHKGATRGLSCIKVLIARVATIIYIETNISQILNKHHSPTI